MVLSNDISEIRTAEQALRKSERLLERSQSTAHVGSFERTLVDTAGENAGSVRWSDETFRILGHEPGAFDVDAATFFEFIHPDDRERVRTGQAAKIQRGVPCENEFRIVRADGVVRDMHTWTMFESDASGRPIRMIGTCQDVTERKRAERELVEADRRKDEFLAMLSHELRNPLAPILNAIEIIERAGPDQADRRSTCQDRHRAAGPAHEAAARRSAGRVARQPGEDRAPQATRRARPAAPRRRWRSAARC